MIQSEEERIDRYYLVGNAQFWVKCSLTWQVSSIQGNRDCRNQREARLSESHALLLVCSLDKQVP